MENMVKQFVQLIDNIESTHEKPGEETTDIS